MDKACSESITQYCWKQSLNASEAYVRSTSSCLPHAYTYLSDYHIDRMTSRYFESIYFESQIVHHEAIFIVGSTKETLATPTAHRCSQPSHVHRHTFATQVYTLGPCTEALLDVAWRLCKVESTYVVML